jgi:tetratricopeptide (TPR) repeat protein
MKIKKEILLGLTVIVIIILGFVILINTQGNKSRRELASRIISLGNGGPPETIEGLREAIGAYEKQIELHVKDAAQTGVYWKILASRLQEKGLHNEALGALEHALYYNPEDAALHYLTGLSAAIVAKTHHNFTGIDNPERDRLYALAEEAYLSSLKIDEKYLRPRYALGVLYVFELDRPQDAIPLMEKYLDFSTNDVDAMFVLARAYFETGNMERTLALYDMIISVTKDESKRREAQNNRQVVMGRLYG